MSTRAAVGLAAAIVCLAVTPVAAQVEDTRSEFWPELDAYVSLGERARLFGLATVSRNREENFAEGTIGIHVDYFLKPLVRPKLRHTPDAIKRHYLTFRAGCRYSHDLADTGDSEEHRVVFETTGRVPPAGGFVLVNRNRLDLRDLNGDWSWRYRNRTRVERDVGLGSRTATPYAMFEIFYDSRYSAWNRKRYFGGIEWPLPGKTVLDTYYCRQDDSRSSVAHVDAVGLALALYF
jgi:hypothetical protein